MGEQAAARGGFATFDAADTALPRRRRSARVSWPNGRSPLGVARGGSIGAGQPSFPRRGHAHISSLRRPVATGKRSHIRPGHLADTRGGSGLIPGGGSRDALVAPWPSAVMASRQKPWAYSPLALSEDRRASRPSPPPPATPGRRWSRCPSPPGRRACARLPWPRRRSSNPPERRSGRSRDGPDPRRQPGPGLGLGLLGRSDPTSHGGKGRGGRSRAPGLESYGTTASALNSGEYFDALPRSCRTRFRHARWQRPSRPRYPRRTGGRAGRPLRFPPARRGRRCAGRYRGWSGCRSRR
ncbi:hypothetical protein OV450_0092 [Actinobacteria bacterium OV450]|nr:hypothetical protein OV450_0092 [Actinobacteria bacterium OV450]